MDKDFEGVGLTPYDPYHNSSFVYSGKSDFMYSYIRNEINKPIIAAFSTQEWASFEQYAINYNEIKMSLNKIQQFSGFVDSF